MKILQKTFYYFFVFTAIFLCLGIFGLVVPKALAVSPGDLIKSPNSSAVYYVGEGNTKYVFPNGTTYLTWYPDFSLVNTVTQETLQNYETSGNVVARAGTKLIQFVTINPDGTMYVDDPKVYALEPNGVKRWLTTAYLAQQLYGTNWETKIYGCPNYLIDNYPTGADLIYAAYPEGSLVKQSGSSTVYYINSDGQKQNVTGAGFTANLFHDEFVNITSLSLDNYPNGTTISANVPALTILAGNTPINQVNNSYYVALSGNDNNTGTLTSPFRTISQAATVAQASDVIYIRGGTYDESVTPPNSGSVDNYITFTNYPGETVYVKGTTGYTFYLDNVDYIKINGLKISRGLGSGPKVIPAYTPYLGTMPHGAGIKIFWADHNIITNNDIYDNDIGILVSEGGLDINNTFPSTYNQIINNTIHHNGEAGIRIKRADYTTVDSNTIYNNGIQGNNVFSELTQGIAFYCSINTTITNNTIYGNSQHAIINYAGTNSETCDASNSYIANNILAQTLTFNTTNPLFANKKIVLNIAEKEITDSSNVYKNNTFYNGSLGNDIVTWGVNNTGTIGEAMTLAEFNAAANALNSESGLGNIEVVTNPI